MTGSERLRSAASWLRHLSLTHGNRAEEWAAALEEEADAWAARERRLEALAEKSRDVLRWYDDDNWIVSDEAESALENLRAALAAGEEAPMTGPEYTPETLRACFAEETGLVLPPGSMTPVTAAKAASDFADAWDADREAAEWKRAFDEGEVVGMRSNATDAENPYPEGSNKYCGWSFGFWQSADRHRLEALDDIAEDALYHAAKMSPEAAEDIRKRLIHMGYSHEWAVARAAGEAINDRSQSEEQGE